MNLQKKHHSLLLILGVAITTLALSACTGTPLPGNEGIAGLSEVTEEPASTEAPLTEVAPATATPIPAASGHIVFASNRNGDTDLHLSTPDGLTTSPLTFNAKVDSSPARLSPDGSKLAFSATINDNTDLYILDLNTNQITRITEAPERDAAPTWSPNGQQLVFESFRDGNLEIYIVNSDGSAPTRLTNDPAGDSNPIWSPTGNEIVFSSNRFGNSDLFLLNLNGTVSTLTTSPVPDNNANWSPDGSFIAFQVFSGELSDICLIGRDGLNQVCLTTRVAAYSTPVWSPNGEWLASNTPTSVVIFNIRDGRVVELTQAGIEPRGTPAWSPDGLRLVFQAQAEGDMEIYQALMLTNEFTRVTTLPGYDGEPVWIAR